MYVFTIYISEKAGDTRSMQVRYTYIHACIYTCMHVYMRKLFEVHGAKQEILDQQRSDIHTYMHIYIYECMYVCMYLHLHIGESRRYSIHTGQIHIHTCMHIYMYACIHEKTF